MSAFVFQSMGMKGKELSRSNHRQLKLGDIFKRTPWLRRTSERGKSSIKEVAVRMRKLVRVSISQGLVSPCNHPYFPNLISIKPLLKLTNHQP